MSCNESLREKLVEITAAILGPDPHTGGAPHPDTVDAIADGLIARCALSNARPAKYADEPWRKQGALEHARHCAQHAIRARLAERHPFDFNAISDLGQPEIVHAGLRADFFSWSVTRGVR